MSIFSYQDYKIWATELIEAMPNRGRGQYRRIAERLNTSSSIVTQVFKGDRELTPEQAILLAEYFGLPEVERRYLLLLVNYARASSPQYKQILVGEIAEVKKSAKLIKNRVQQNAQLSEEAKATFYSSWYYLAIWSLTAIPGYDTVDTISERLQISRSKTRGALEFMIRYSLVIEENGKFRMGPNLLHLESTSPHIPRHHQNWRLRAFQKYENLRPQDAFYTAAVTLSEGDALKLRENIMKFLSDTVSLIKDSPSEKLYAFCLDWFEV